jgi:hypothetical protein
MDIATPVDLALGRQRFLTEVSRHTDLSGIGVPGNAVASCSVDVAD